MYLGMEFELFLRQENQPDDCFGTAQMLSFEVFCVVL